MWQDCLDSEITFWVLLIADIAMLMAMFYAIYLNVQDRIEHRKYEAERLKYLEWLENFKDKDYD